MPDTRKVLLLIESARGFGRDLIKGIASYARFHGPWSIYTYAPFFRSIEKNREILNRLQGENIDGVISRQMRDVSILEQMNIPVIFASTIKPKNVQVPEKFPIIASDNQQIGKLAAEHLINCGFTNFAYCGYSNIGWSQERFNSFQRALNKKGFKANNYLHPSTKKLQHWEHERSILANWLCSIPKPVGIMTCSDDRSRDLIEASKTIDIRIPEEVAVLGVDNDNLLCEMTNPTLSSIATDTENAGFRAAELLDNLMLGRDKLRGQKIIINSTHVEIRHSTDVLVIKDDEVLSAMQYIRDNGRQMIVVDDVVKSTCLSRRSLERRFSKTLDRSVNDEICRVRIDHISKMLSETNMTQLQIAHAVGFSSIDNLRRFFHRKKSLTPLEYRKQHCRIVGIMGN